MIICNLHIPSPDDRISRYKLDYSVLVGIFDSEGENAAYMWVKCV